MKRKLVEPGDLTVLRAGLYGLILRERGYAPDEAALLVVSRYPTMRPNLQALLSRRESEEHEEASRAAGGAS